MEPLDRDVTHQITDGGLNAIEVDIHIQPAGHLLFCTHPRKGQPNMDLFTLANFGGNLRIILGAGGLHVGLTGEADSAGLMWAKDWKERYEGERAVVENVRAILRAGPEESSSYAAARVVAELRAAAGHHREAEGIVQDVRGILGAGEKEETRSAAQRVVGYAQHLEAELRVAREGLALELARKWPDDDGHERAATQVADVQRLELDLLNQILAPTNGEHVVATAARLTATVVRLRAQVEANEESLERKEASEAELEAGLVEAKTEKENCEAHIDRAVEEMERSGVWCDGLITVGIRRMGERFDNVQADLLRARAQAVRAAADRDEAQRAADEAIPFRSEVAGARARLERDDAKVDPVLYPTLADAIDKLILERKIAMEEEQDLRGQIHDLKRAAEGHGAQCSAAHVVAAAARASSEEPGASALGARGVNVAILHVEVRDCRHCEEILRDRGRELVHDLTAAGDAHRHAAPTATQTGA